MRKLIIILFPLIFNLHASIASEIRTQIRWSDPQNILLATDEFVGWQPYEIAFRDGQEITLLAKECITYTSCDEQIIILKIKSTSAGFESHTYNESGKLISKEKISEDIWNSWAGNTLRSSLGDLENSGYQVEIQNMHSHQMTIDINDMKTSLEVKTIDIFGKNFLGQTIQTKISLSRDLTGLAQRVFKSELQDSTGIYREWTAINVKN